MTLGCKTSKDVMKAIKDHGAQMVDIRFTDMPGMWQHTSYPAQVFEQDPIDDGLGFDGSSIRGFKVINESDMLLQPDPTTAFIDPFMAAQDPGHDRRHQGPGDQGVLQPRSARRRQEGRGVPEVRPGSATPRIFGPEAEFFVFDNVQYGTGQQYSSYSVDSREGHWNSNQDEGPNLGYKIRPKEGYFPLPAQRHAAGPARRDGADHDRHRPHGRMPAPRGRDRRPVRDRHEVRFARWPWPTTR